MGATRGALYSRLKAGRNCRRDPRRIRGRAGAKQILRGDDEMPLALVSRRRSEFRGRAPHASVRANLRLRAQRQAHDLLLLLPRLARIQSCRLASMCPRHLLLRLRACSGGQGQTRGPRRADAGRASRVCCTWQVAMIPPIA